MQTAKRSVRSGGHEVAGEMRHRAGCSPARLHRGPARQVSSGAPAPMSPSTTIAAFRAETNNLDGGRLHLRPAVLRPPSSNGDSAQVVRMRHVVSGDLATSG